MNTTQPTESTGLAKELQQLLAEDIDHAKQRERRTLDDLAGRKRSFVLFGAGRLGRRCLAALRHHGIEPVGFADNNTKLWNTTVEGLRVFSPTDAAQLFGKTSVFVVTIWGARGHDRMIDRLSAVAALGCDTVVPFGPLLWRYPFDDAVPHYAVDLPHRVLTKKQQVLDVFALWGDEDSRKEYVAQLRWRLFFDFGAMLKPDVDTIYFPPDLLVLEANEFFVDCGAFDGDTVRHFLATSNGRFDRILAFEPDPENFHQLQSVVDSLPASVRERIETRQAAVLMQEGIVRFSAEGNPSSHVGQGELAVEGVSLDRYLRQRRATFIKMDIEGAEPAALTGAMHHIREHQPILAVSCYHRQDHLWSIPSLISSIDADYTLFLRPHDLDGWDLVCYAIPRSRLRTH